jgi:hypothetical protein
MSAGAMLNLLPAGYASNHNFCLRCLCPYLLKKLALAYG